MKLHEIRKFMDSVKYKPGFKYVLRSDYEDNFVIQLDFKVQDVLNPTKETVGSVVIMLQADLPLEVLRFKLINAVRTFEGHEIDEWLKIGGEYVQHPHPVDTV